MELGDAYEPTNMDYVIYVLAYLGVAFIYTFFEFCTVYTIKVRFGGGNSTMGEAIKFSFSRLPQIFLWTLINAIVGLILRALDQAARNAGNAGRIILSIIRWMAGLAWSILSMFVIPAMVYYDLSPGKAMKRSSRAFSKTWGENLVRGFGIFLFYILLYLTVFGVGAVVWVLTKSIVITAIVVVSYALVGTLILGVIDKVYHVALFEYAETGAIPGTYDHELIKKAFKPQKSSARAF